jgi:hypothetical protein
MKIDIQVVKNDLDYYQATALFDERIKSCMALSFMYTIVDIGDKLHNILGIDILSDEHELTITLKHEN